MVLVEAILMRDVSLIDSPVPIRKHLRKIRLVTTGSFLDTRKKSRTFTDEFICANRNAV